MPFGSGFLEGNRGDAADDQMHELRHLLLLALALHRLAVARMAAGRLTTVGTLSNPAAQWCGT
jgi:hypothetical protein